MFTLLRLFNFRHLRRRPLEALLSLLGIAIGVAVMAGIDLANDNALRSFRKSVDAISGRATHQILGSAAGIPDTMAATILRQSLLTATPVVEYVAACREADNDAVHVLGIDPFTDTAFRDYSNLSDSSATLLSARSLPLLTQPGAGLLSETFAATHGLRLPDTLHLLVGSEWRPVFVIGTLAPELLTRLGFDNLLLLDLSSAQEVLGRLGYVDRIDLMADEDRIAGLRTALPHYLRLEPPAGRSRRVEEMIRAYRLNLTALSFLAVFVGMFLIYNTMEFAVLHRRKQIGILRCLGVTPRQVIGNALLEALAVGGIGVALGLALGVLLAQYATHAVRATISELYVFLEVEGVTVRPAVMVKAAGLGLVATLFASVVPALEAAGISAAVAVRRSSLEWRARTFVPWFAAASLVALILGLLVYLHSTSFLGGLLVALLVGLAAIFLTPLLTIGLTVISAPLAQRHAGQPGLLATRSIRAALSRTSVAIAALMLALAMVLGMRLMITSFRATINDWVNGALQGDVYLRPLGFATAKWSATLSPAFLDFLARQPGVAALTQYGATEFRYRGAPIYLVEVSPEVLQTRSQFTFTTGTGAQHWPRLLAGDVIVSEIFSRRFGKAAGDTLVLPTLAGLQPFPIAAVIIDYSLDQGQVMMSHETYARCFGPPRITNAALYLEPGVAVADYVRALRRAVAGRFAVEINSHRELRAEVLRIFDQSFAITQVMQILAGIVAVIGIISAVMSLLVERTRELGILRAVGMTLAQLRRMILLESGLMGVFAGLIALPTGTALALVLIYVINLRTFGWAIPFRLEAAAYLQTFLLASGAALLAAFYPMQRLKRLPIASAIREE
ncbi:MAG: ABC transporter permease [candidate division KSB1 bacterium]|nr:ABC transporter permease [candidate division KSB1 bacterium]MDZ7272724.1 ABC transporter permease [candidate division KSB1 bacterium]MDZ7284251.1 ABC transporter permease [candidate division KSB1 bacterium]MDZ7297350.1 ABC transporter permease [candidate division KSB1 bacterium]MDZ7307059.1 ABC transporter permease [candidate division KSB1 bacterium]